MQQPIKPDFHQLFANFLACLEKKQLTPINERKLYDRVYCQLFGLLDHLDSPAVVPSMADSELSTLASIEQHISQKLYQKAKMARDIFLQMDVCNTLTLSLAELQLGLSQIGCVISTPDLLRLVAKYDLSHSGRINYRDFLALFEPCALGLQTSSHAAHSAQALYHSPATDRRTAHELRQIAPPPEIETRRMMDLVSSKLQQRSSTVLPLFRLFDTYGLGRIPFAELQAGLQTLGVPDDLLAAPRFAEWIRDVAQRHGTSGYLDLAGFSELVQGVPGQYVASPVDPAPEETASVRSARSPPSTPRTPRTPVSGTPRTPRASPGACGTPLTPLTPRTPPQTPSSLRRGQGLRDLMRSPRSLGSPSASQFALVRIRGAAQQCGRSIVDLHRVFDPLGEGLRAFALQRGLRQHLGVELDLSQCAELIAEVAGPECDALEFGDFARLVTGREEVIPLLAQDPAARALGLSLGASDALRSPARAPALSETDLAALAPGPAPASVPALAPAPHAPQPLPALTQAPAVSLTDEQAAALLKRVNAAVYDSRGARQAFRDIAGTAQSATPQQLADGLSRLGARMTPGEAVALLQRVLGTVAPLSYSAFVRLLSGK